MVSSLVVHLHCHLLTSWTYALGTPVLRLHHSHRCHSLRLKAQLVAKTVLLTFPFKQSLQTQWRVRFAWRLACALWRHLNYRWALIICWVQRCMPKRCQLVHLTLTLTWLLHLTGPFLTQYMAVGYSLPLFTFGIIVLFVFNNFQALIMAASIV